MVPLRRPFPSIRPAVGAAEVVEAAVVAAGAGAVVGVDDEHGNRPHLFE